MLTFAAFIFVLGVLIFVHELGHFMAAKAVGIAVPRFSIGFGPATPLKFQRGETEYLISWIPFGGYVKMASLEEQQAMASLEGGDLEQEFPPERLFESKSLPARILVLAAGVIMNALFAWVAYTGLLTIYGRAEDPTTALARIDATALPDAAEALAAVPAGARIVRINLTETMSRPSILRAVLDPQSKRLQFDFAAAESVVLEVPGSDRDARQAIARALIPLWEPRLASVTSGPAAEAELKEGDLITAIDGAEIHSWDEMVRIIKPSAGAALSLTVLRDGVEIEKTVVPEEAEVEDPRTGETEKVGRIGIAGPKLEPKWVDVDFPTAIPEAASRAWSDAGQILALLKGMLMGQISPRNLGGPILIAQASGQAARRGFDYLLTLMALLSINLAILNLLPIPVLDGGHLVFLVLEGIRGKPLPQALRLRLTQVGMFLLLGIMALALINDIFRIVG